MKKIVFVMPQLFGGGAERVVAVLAEEINKAQNIEVHLITYLRNGEKDYPVSDRIQWHSMKKTEESALSRILNKVRFLKNTIRQIQPDCVISLAGPAMVTLLTIAMKGTDIPLILSERNDPRSYPKQVHLRFLRNWAYQKSAAVVFQTHEAKGFFHSGIQRKGSVITNPLTAMLPDPYTGIRENRIVTSCRLTPQKNLDLLIDAFSDLAEEFPETLLDIYGEGPEHQRLDEKIKALQLSHRVTLHGYSSNIYEDIRKAALYVSSSDYEGISNSMLEAIALGIPTVCTDCPAGGARETIEHGVNGLLVPVGNRESLTKAMRTLLLDTVYADSLGQCGIALREKISVSAVVKQWMTVIEQLW